ncbi:A24 family peptidase [bacterium]|nr:A24 family peptidase [bacterium]
MIYAGLFAIGAIFGSFLNVLIYRLPRGQSVVSPPSSCPQCGERIRPWENVPILSYLFLRGRCAHCGVHIPERYPVVEFLAGVVPVLLFARYGFGHELALFWPLSCVLIVLSFIDLDLRIIPDRVTLPGIVAGLVLAPLLGVTTLTGSLIGAVAGGGALYLIAVFGEAAFGKESMGGGDIKLAAMLGAFIGWQAVLILLFAAFFSGAVVGIVALAVKGRDWDRSLPFGPFIAGGAFLAVVWGDAIIAWYAALGA